MSQPKPDIGQWRPTPIKRRDPEEFINSDPEALRERLEKGSASVEELTIPVTIRQAEINPKSPKIQANLRIRKDYYDRLKTISKLTDTPMGDIIDAALGEYLPRLVSRLPTELKI